MTAAASPAPPVGVVLVDDSPVQRRFMRAAIEADSDFTVVAEARNGSEAVALVARLRLRMVSRIRVITHPRGRLRTQGLHASVSTAATSGGRRPLST
ncbi:MAG: hypothetical protein JWN88_3111, partial [Frankiales bacterium]|nr:hypothetical protein [Frankiales bacterium]